MSHKFVKCLTHFKTVLEGYCFFPVGSETRYNLDFVKAELTKRLATISKRQTNKDSKVVPIKWWRALDVLKLYQKENNNFVSKENLFEMISEFGFSSLGDTNELLSFLHKRNEVIVFEEIDILEDFMVLNKTFLYFCAYQLINRRYITKSLNDKLIRSRIREEALRNDYIMFPTKKLLSRDLIEFIWKNNNH